MAAEFPISASLPVGGRLPNRSNKILIVMVQSYKYKINV